MIPTRLTSVVFFAVSTALAYSFERDIDALFPVRRDSIDNDNSTVWPTPFANGGKAWGAAFAKANAIVSQMTVEELVNLTTGIPSPCSGGLGAVPRFNIPELCLNDGPTGPRATHGSSQFPGGVTVAATWDRSLMYLRNKAMGQEFHDQGVHIPLAPVTGGPLGRAVLDGRAWEGTFADPYACGEASYQSTVGMLESGVATTAKHWIAYEQETFRNYYTIDTASEQLPISSNLDDKTMHELYMWPFAEAVRAGTSHVMCSYNRINNTHSCNNAKSLNNLLKTELNFQGSVMSDWGGQWNDLLTAKNGMDIGMPGSGFIGLFGTFWGENLIALVENGTVSEDILRDKVVRTLTSYFYLGQDVNPLPEFIYNGVGQPLWNGTSGFRNVRKPGTAKLIKEIGTSSVTLLKNIGGLPLSKPRSIAVLGNDATDNVLGTNACGSTYSGCDVTNLNGTLSTGGGSGSNYAPYIITPLDALKQRAIEDGSEIGAVVRHVNNTYSEAAIATLLTQTGVDATLVFVNRWSEEGYDVLNLDLGGNGDELISQAVNYSSNVIIVIHTTGVVDIEKWVNNDNVTAIVVAYLPGQEAGNSLVPVLYGDVAPSGKLPWTWGKSVDDYPPNGVITDDVYSPQSNFTEGVFIDYRWFDMMNITPRYEFGFGLSYTTFSYSNLWIDATSSKDASSIMETAENFAESDGTNSLYDILFTASATITNSGNVTGSEVAQLYISIPEESQPVRMLRGFDKVKNLAPGASATAAFPIRRKDVSVWSVVDQQWYIPNGTFTISVGASSRILPLNITWTP
ncbi:beta-D-xylosidase/beta-D-glucosidase [Gymnopus androsaceus JB14]|uniref:Probable beta-glucosidase G n=1 Tax=Gymnopus androsaceus JB14 TaxID=1447944 RepID=A0A6A4HVF6_9AGAR|nr:beta-D-xylosidase/beta-D-glucosidase [Gymnopus androsaceus JB14]